MLRVQFSGKHTVVDRFRSRQRRQLSFQFNRRGSETPVEPDHHTAASLSHDIIDFSQLLDGEA